MRRIAELDGIRTIAVVGVMASHIAPFRNIGMLGEFGRAGVDAFFVLSGYLITTILLQLKSQPHPYRTFYARRILRIIPPYALLLLLVYIGGTLHHDLFEPKKFAGQVLFLRCFAHTREIIPHIRTALHTPLASQLFGHWPPSKEHDFPRLPISASLGPTWSLSVEEWFYVLWAPAVLILSRRSLGLFAAAACLVGFLLRLCWAPNGNFFTCFDILATGALLALWIQHRESASPALVRRADIVLNVLALSLLSVFLIVTYLHRGSFQRTIFAFGISGLYAFLIRKTGTDLPITRALRFGPLVYTGVISYMLYLIHLPAYFVVRGLLTHSLSSFPPLTREWVIAMTTVAAAWALAALSWHYFESPILGYKHQFETLVLPHSASEAQWIKSNPDFSNTQ